MRRYNKSSTCPRYGNVNAISNYVEIVWSVFFWNQYFHSFSSIPSPVYLQVLPSLYCSFNVLHQHRQQTNHSITLLQLHMALMKHFNYPLLETHITVTVYLVQRVHHYQIILQQSLAGHMMTCLSHHFLWTTWHPIRWSLSFHQRSTGSKFKIKTFL